MRGVAATSGEGLRARRLGGAPLIFIAPSAAGSPLGAATQLAELLGGRPAHSLVSVCESLEFGERRLALVTAHRRHTATWPEHRVTMLCNTERDLFFLQSEGVPSIVCNSGIFVSERVFAIEGSRPKRFDAIYNARMVALKRHVLAREVERLGLIYYDVECAEPGYYESVRRALARATFLNEEVARAAPARSAHRRAAELANRLIAARGFVMLPPAAVARHLNEARVGLCLSHDEAAMRAGVEYLLCGLPVVSTPTLGGRDFFFDAEYALTVPADPRAVRDAVAALIARAIPPETIRERVLWKIRQERRKLQDFVRAIFTVANRPPRFDDAWDRLFTESEFVATPLDHLLAAEPPP